VGSPDYAKRSQGYTPPAASASQYQSIPMDKIEDFGVHANQYYQLKVEIYKTKLDEQLLDLLWNKYWVATLSQSLLVSVSSSAWHHSTADSTQNRSYATSQTTDLAEKIRSATDSLGNHQANLRIKKETAGAKAPGDKGKGAAPNAVDEQVVEDEETPLSKVAKDR
jgi:COP9 signalosome complex subunit 5